MFFDDEVIQLIVTNTNRYAMQKGAHNFLVEAPEMRIFLAILVTSGYVPLPRRRMFWEPSDDVHNVAISQAMTRNRFEQIMQYLHVADNDNLVLGDKLTKV